MKPQESVPNCRLLSVERSLDEGGAISSLAEMLAQGKPLPVERKLVDTVVILLA